MLSVTAQRQFQGENPLELSNPSSKVVGWDSGRYQGAGSSRQGGHSSSGVGKNSQEMPTWLHHFLAFRVRKAPGEICPCLFLTGHTGPHGGKVWGTPRAAVQLSSSKSQWMFPKSSATKEKEEPAAGLKQGGTLENEWEIQPRAPHGDEEEEERTCCLPSCPTDCFLLLSSLPSSSGCSCRLRLP